MGNYLYFSFYVIRSNNLQTNSAESVSVNLSSLTILKQSEAFIFFGINII